MTTGGLWPPINPARSGDTHYKPLAAREHSPERTRRGKYLAPHRVLKSFTWSKIRTECDLCPPHCCL